MKKGAYISSCKKYRYQLYRSWDPKKKLCSFIMLNPSTADDKIDDPTIRRCIGYAKKFGFGSMYVINLFAYRTPNKNILKEINDPIGPENDKIVEEIANKSDIIILAQGNDGKYKNRSKEILNKLSKNRYKIYCLKLSKLNEPCHPLYLRYDIPLTLLK